jgi:hypothetical protein
VFDPPAHAGGTDLIMTDQLDKTDAPVAHQAKKRGKQKAGSAFSLN